MRRHRSVLTRLERLKTLLAKGAWADTQSPLGLPKVKHLRIRVKKEKAAAPEAAPGAPAAAEGTKPAAGATAAKVPAAAAAKPDAKKK